LSEVNDGSLLLLIAFL